MTRIKWQSFDGSEREALIWNNVANAKGVVQIIHGMAEHAFRYDDFARFLNSGGYIAAALEQRAHKGAKIQGFEEGDIFEDTVNDNLAFTTYLKAKYDLPVSVLGHSYGSMITQRYIQHNPPVKCAILSATAARTDFLAKVGLLLANFQKVLFGGAKPAKLIDKLTFGAFDKPFKDENQKFAWVTRDKAILEEYLTDPLCGYVMSINFQASFMAALQKIIKDESVSQIDKSLPILLISGDCDPVGGNGKFVEELYGIYKKNGLEKIALKFYKGARHEILNEINRAEVYGDILSFLNK
ncbi:MAG: alpha/beta hydrolase [Clostridiales bacterium]|jgi:alpha-beta hydrolase superfamily lysophospholipase|nr:alpha/beta hydrolase [Clostridiales bacterium]